MEKPFYTEVFEEKFRKVSGYGDSENGRLQFALMSRDKEAARFYRDKVLEKWSWTDEELIRNMRLDNLNVKEFYCSLFGISEPNKNPKEIQVFLDLLNSGDASMDELKAAAKDAEKWVLTAVFANR